MSYVGKVKATDGAELSLIGTTLFGKCTVSASTATKSVTIDGLDQVFDGLTVFIWFKYSNTASAPKLQIQGSGLAAKPIYRYGMTKPGNTPETSWYAQSVVALTYSADSNAWFLDGWLNSDSNSEYGDATQTQHGLMSVQDKIKLDGMEIVTYTNVSVSNWTTDDTQPGYTHKAVLSLAKATANHVPVVYFSTQQIQSYNPAPVAISGAGTVTIFVESQPEGSIQIPTVQLIKGAAGT